MRDVLLGKAQRAFNRIRAGFGLAPISHLFLDHPAHASDVYLQSTVEAFEYPRSDLPASVRFVGAAQQRGCRLLDPADLVVGPDPGPARSSWSPRALSRPIRTN